MVLGTLYTLSKCPVSLWGGGWWYHGEQKAGEEYQSNNHTDQWKTASVLISRVEIFWVLWQHQEEHWSHQGVWKQSIPKEVTLYHAFMGTHYMCLRAPFPVIHLYFFATHFFLLFSFHSPRPSSSQAHPIALKKILLGSKLTNSDCPWVLVPSLC